MSPRKDTRVVTLLALMIGVGMGLLVIPWLLTPPAYLDLAIRDEVFGTDLSAHRVTVTDVATGKAMTAAIRKLGNAFVVHIGRINSGKTSYTARVAGYHPGTAKVDAAALQNVRASIDLEPAFGRIEISPVNATRRDELVDATVKNGGRTMTPNHGKVIVVDVPPGTHRFTAAASGYCPAEREFDVREGKVTKAVLPLSPDLTDQEIARFVLGWHNEPRDLDSHFRKNDAVGFPHPSHLYFRQKSGTFADGAVFAHLDIDELYPGKYETVTVRANAVGSYRYFVHLYAGSGTINDADARVEVYTRGCQMHAFTPPPGCSERIWNVAEVQYDGANVALTPLSTCAPAYGPPVIK